MCVCARALASRARDNDIDEAVVARMHVRRLLYAPANISAFLGARIECAQSSALSALLSIICVALCRLSNSQLANRVPFNYRCRWYISIRHALPELCASKHREIDKYTNTHT